MAIGRTFLSVLLFTFDAATIPVAGVGLYAFKRAIQFDVVRGIDMVDDRLFERDLAPARHWLLAHLRRIPSESR